MVLSACLTNSILTGLFLIGLFFGFGNFFNLRVSQSDTGVSHRKYRLVNKFRVVILFMYSLI